MHLPKLAVRSAASWAAAAAVLAGCSGGGEATPAPTPAATSAATGAPAPGTQTVIADPDDIDPARLEPLLGLRACDAPPAGIAGLDPGPLPLPDAAVLTSASDDGPLMTAQGYSERTPVEIMVAYLRLDGWTPLSAEDEVFESELLIERDGLRVFVKAQAVCDRGSAFVLFGSDDDELVPAPAGGAGG